MWYTFYKQSKRLRSSTNTPTARDFLRLLRGYRLKITREPLDLATLRPMREHLVKIQEGR